MLFSTHKEIAMHTHKIAVIAGDGIGKEVMPEGIRVVDAAARRFSLASNGPAATTTPGTAR